jgi:hypothetical protein
MRCPKCQAFTRIDLQSLIDCEGMKYRRACASCSWDAWEVQPGKPADVSRASLALALEAAFADPDPASPDPEEASEHEPDYGHRPRPVRHALGNGLARRRGFDVRRPARTTAAAAAPTGSTGGRARGPAPLVGVAETP